MAALPLCSLTAISPVDGRYASKVAQLRGAVSEYGLIRQRSIVEIQWLLLLSETEGIPECPVLCPEARAALQEIADNFSVEDAERVKEIERTTNHDVKAVEYFLKEKMKAGHEQLTTVFEFVHFACTSEDINNLSYSLMLQQACRTVLQPKMVELLAGLKRLGLDTADQPMMALTHGQPATPTTFGKELANSTVRLHSHLQRLEAVQFMGKFNGAVGNFNAHVVAYPNVEWPSLARKFVEERLGLVYQPMSTQIECHDYIALMSDALAAFNTCLMDLDRDMWSYIQRGLLKLKAVAGEVGSSTMPHKVNPIDFENSEGNVGVANALFRHFADKLPVSRMQRDLTDSTVLRVIGVGLAHSLIAYESTLRALGRIAVHEETMRSELSSSWMLLAEPIQTVLRKKGVEGAYEKLKELTRGQEVDEQRMRTFIDSLEKEQLLDAEDTQRLRELSPVTYVGLAGSLTRDALNSLPY